MYIVYVRVLFSERELQIIKVWSNNIIHGGHWGDGDVVFPDESILLSILEEAPERGAVDLSFRNLEILLIWSESLCGTPEEVLLRERLDAMMASCMVED